MEDLYNLGALTKEMIVSRLKDIHNAPTVAAEIAKKTMVAAVRSTQTSGQTPQEIITRISQGAMSGLILIEKDLPEGAVEILRCTAEVSSELQLDPAELMTWALEGIARITPLITPSSRGALREAIEQSFNGVGEVFDGLTERAKDAPKI